MAQPAYDFSMFEDYYGTAAPELVPDYQPDEPVSPPARRKKKTKTHGISNADRKATRVSSFKSMKAIACTIFVFAVVCVAMYLNVTLDETAKMINSVENSISIAQSENVRLESALEGMVSIDKVKDYAENNLGMVKLENYKITYFESEEDNHVVVSGGKSYRTGSLSEKIQQLKEYFSNN